MSFELQFFYTYNFLVVLVKLISNQFFYRISLLYVSSIFKNLKTNFVKKSMVRLAKKNRSSKIKIYLNFFVNFFILFFQFFVQIFYSRDQQSEAKRRLIGKDKARRFKLVSLGILFRFVYILQKFHWCLIET